MASASGDEVPHGLNDWFINGAQAEYCVVKPAALARKPQSIDHVQSAVVPISALTAWQGTFREGQTGAWPAGSDSRRGRRSGEISPCRWHIGAVHTSAHCPVSSSTTLRVCSLAGGGRGDRLPDDTLRGRGPRGEHRVRRRWRRNAGTLVGCVGKEWQGGQHRGQKRRGHQPNNASGMPSMLVRADGSQLASSKLRT